MYKCNQKPLGMQTFYNEDKTKLTLPKELFNTH